MNAGQHLGNTEKILENLNWKGISFSQDTIKYFQVLNWIPDYVSLMDLVRKFEIFAIIDYFPLPLPYLGKPSFNFFSMKKEILNLAENTIINLQKKSFHSYHFDSLNSFDAIINHWNWLEEKIKQCLEKLDTIEDQSIKQHMLYSLLAETLHAVQDFYSHSNWIEFFHEEFHYSKKEEFPTWFDIFVENNDEFKFEKEECMRIFSEQNKLYTGYFPLGKDKKLFPIYHNDKTKRPGLNKDRAERPYFEIVYYLAYKNGIQWMNYLKVKYLTNTHLELLKASLPLKTIQSANKIQPYVKKITFKLREWNGVGPFENLSIDIPILSISKNILKFTVKISSSDLLIKYDRDFRKSFFNIIIKSDSEVIFKIPKFGNKSGVTKILLNLNEIENFSINANNFLRVEYGLLIIEKLIINKN